MAECLLAALGSNHDDESPEYIRAYVGATLLADALLELTNLRKALTTPAPK
jgi:hypothetical protein